MINYPCGYIMYFRKEVNPMDEEKKKSTKLFNLLVDILVDLIAGVILIIIDKYLI